jgi:hypothetical protein
VQDAPGDGLGRPQLGEAADHLANEEGPRPPSTLLSDRKNEQLKKVREPAMICQTH